MSLEFIKVENIKTFGSNALLFEWPQEVKPEVLYSILAIKQHLEQLQINGLIESILGYASLTLFFKHKPPEPEMILRLLTKCPESLLENVIKSSKTIELPVCYDKIFAIDWAYTESATGLSFKDIVQIHSQSEYLVYFIGFIPGFMYLGGLDSRLNMPRKETPRIEVPSGSVGIAGMQTGIYPFTHPGGWQIIGKCPVRLFEHLNNPHCLANPGDIVKFRPVTLSEFLKI